VWLALGMTALGYSGLFGSFAYIAPMMTQVAGFSASSVTWLLILFGVGLVVGNLAGGRLADRWLMPTIFVLLTALAVVLAVFTFTAHNQVAAAITIVVLGAVGFGSVPPLQLHIMRRAGDAPALASAANIGAFNLGNAIGPFLGGPAIDAGLGYTAPNWVGAIATTSGIAVAAVAAVLLRRDRRTAGARTAGTPLPAPETTRA
jgi:DHA1 family inner membrane transport protein